MSEIASAARVRYVDAVVSVAQDARRGDVDVAGAVEYADAVCAACLHLRIVQPDARADVLHAHAVADVVAKGRARDVHVKVSPMRRCGHL